MKIKDEVLRDMQVELGTEISNESPLVKTVDLTLQKVGENIDKQINKQKQIQERTVFPSASYDRVDELERLKKKLGLK